MRKNWKAFALTMFLMFAAFTGLSSAQSGDPDNPTPLSSKELKGSLGGADKELYYSFLAGPGKVTITVDIKASEGVASMTLIFRRRNPPTFWLCRWRVIAAASAKLIRLIWTNGKR
jgi:hypothetical protein